MEGRVTWQRAILVALLALLSAGIIVSVTSDDSKVEIRVGDGTPAIGETVPVDTADPDTKPDTDLQLTERAEGVAQDYVDDPGDLAPEMGEPPLSGTGPQHNVGQVPAPLAADEITGCRTRFLPTNFSSRGVAQSQVVIFELHFTAGRDIPGSRADVDGLTAFGARASSRVSWHFNLDKDGNCDYNVPLRLKSWTIAGLNPYTVNVEVAGAGEAPYLREAGYRKLASIIRQTRRAYPGIKFRVAATDGNCHPTKGGIGTHWMGGPCSGGHSDIKPHELQAVVAKLRSYDRPISDRQKRRCQALNRLRVKARPPGPQWTDQDKRDAARYKAGFKRWRLKCVAPKRGKSGRIVRV